MGGEFWGNLDLLVLGSEVRIDRPAGTSHPRFPEFVFPFDYGYLENTCSKDGGGLDVWIGSEPGKRVTGVICTVDMVKRDSEIKLLVGCTPREARCILAVHNRPPQAGVLIERNHNE